MSSISIFGCSRSSQFSLAQGVKKISSVPSKAAKLFTAPMIYCVEKGAYSWKGVKKVVARLDALKKEEFSAANWAKFHKEIASCQGSWGYRHVKVEYIHALSQRTDREQQEVFLELLKGKTAGESFRYLDFFFTLTLGRELNVAASIEAAKVIAVGTTPAKAEVVQKLQEATGGYFRFVKNMLLTITNTFLKSYDFSIADAPPRSRWEATHRLHEMTDLFDTLIGWLDEILCYIDAKTEHFGYGMYFPYLATFGVLLVVALVVRKLRLLLDTAPLALNNDCINITRKYQDGDRPVIGRGKEVDMIAGCFDKKGAQVRVPLLLGKPGVGKSEAVNAFSWDVAHGKYPHLEGVHVYHVNAATLLDFGGGDDDSNLYASRLQILLKEVESVKEGAILFIDEIHKLMPASSKGNLQMGGDLGQELKSILDRKRIRVIGATTLEEGRVIQADKALYSRFMPIFMEEPTLEDCVQILDRVVRKEFPEVVGSDGVYREILKLTGESDEDIGQPRKAKDFLKLVANSVSSRVPAEVKEVRASEAEIGKIRRELSDEMMVSENDERFQEQVRLREDLTRKQKLLEEKQSLKKAYQRFFDEKTHLVNSYARLVRKLASMKPSDPHVQAAARAFRYYQEVVKNYLDNETNIWRAKMMNAGMSPVITIEMVRELFQIEQEQKERCRAPALSSCELRARSESFSLEVLN